MKYVSLYSRHGKHKRLIKFKNWFNALQYLKKRFGNDIKNPKLKNYFLKETKS